MWLKLQVLPFTLYLMLLSARRSGKAQLGEWCLRIEENWAVNGCFDHSKHKSVFGRGNLNRNQLFDAVCASILSQQPILGGMILTFNQNQTASLRPTAFGTEVGKALRIF